MSKNHTHDVQGETYNEDITVGPEIVTYKVTLCSQCGNVAERAIVSRRPA